MTKTPLPVDAALPTLLEALRQQRLVVVQAPPGTGKTTRIPPSLISQDWLKGKKVVMLEPRRVAARAAAERMASERGERVGETIGVRSRLDTRVSGQTRIEVVTEGVLTRMMLSDPSLDGYGAVIFDELHERSVHADTALAFVRESMEALRPDLRVIAMSATFDTEALATTLGTDSVIQVDAATHPVHVTYRPPLATTDADSAVAEAIFEVLHNPEHKGDVLVFLPGHRSISRVDGALKKRLGAKANDDLAITALHGGLSPTQQDSALRLDPSGRRKIILSTPIAETSVTIDGVATVIDSGLRRRPILDIGRGMTSLRTVTASRAAADQRAGRAGRQRPGTCVRIWPSRDDEHRPKAEPPEITATDLTALTLDVAAWGASDPRELTWIDAPPETTVERAKSLLHTLGLIDSKGRITAHGRAAHSLGAEPRLAHMLTMSVDLEPELPGSVATACLLAASMSDRDVLRGGHREVDLRVRVHAMTSNRNKDVDRQAANQAKQMARRWQNRLAPDCAPANEALVGLLTSLAFPDRIAQQRGRAGSFLLTSGVGVQTGADNPLAGAPWLAIAETTGEASDARIVTAAPLDVSEIERFHGARITEETFGGWDRKAGDVRFEHQTRIGAAILQRRPQTEPTVEHVVEAMLDGLRTEGLRLLNWTAADHRIRSRLAFVNFHDPNSWPAVDDAALLESAHQWLAPEINRSTRRKTLQTLKVGDALLRLLDWRQTRELDLLAPTHWDAPSGSRVPIDYSVEGNPVLAVRIQEVFGLIESPRLFDGRVPLTMELLSPAHRPVQVTQDLRSFWADGYSEVRRELRGRYPRHHWPEEPLSATPTNRAKRKN